MAPSAPRLRILSGTCAVSPVPDPKAISNQTDPECVIVGGNPISAFLSWRLQATNACDVTLVWKTGYEQVSQYGLSFK